MTSLLSRSEVRLAAASRIYQASGRLACLLPAAMVGPVSWTAGGIGYAALGRRRRLVAAHIAAVQGLPPSPLDTWRSFSGYARYWLDFFRAPTLGYPAVRDRVSIEGLEHLQAVFDSHRGAVIALPHLGRFDGFGLWAAATGHPLMVVAEEVEPPELFDWFCQMRRNLGLEVVGARASASVKLVRRLEAGGLVALVADRVVTSTGVDVKMFGRQLQLPAGPVVLALRARVPLIPAATYARGRRYQAVVRPPVDLTGLRLRREDIQIGLTRLARSFEELIGRDPCDWHVFQPIFVGE